MKNKEFWKTGFILISVILVLLVGLVSFLFGRGDIKLDGNNKENSSSATEKPLVTSTPNSVLEIEAIKQAVYEKTGLNNLTADITVSEYTSNYAKGGVKEKEGIGGAYFIAAKVDSKWICVYDGQSHPTCEELESYNFPKEMVSECINENNIVVER